MRTRLPFVEVVAVSALNGERLDQLTPFLKPETTVALLRWTDESGVGGAFEDVLSLAQSCRFTDCSQRKWKRIHQQTKALYRDRERS